MDWKTNLAGWRQRTVIQGDRVTVETTQDPYERQLILERNQALRNERPQNDLTFGRQVASIPFEDYYQAIRDYPGLKSADKQERERAWAQFLARPESQKYKVQ